MLLDLLAFCASGTVNAVRTKVDRHEAERFAHADQLAAALRLDMADWFQPTAENYFSRIGKAGIIAALRRRKAAPPPRGRRRRSPNWPRLPSGNWRTRDGCRNCCAAREQPHLLFLPPRCNKLHREGFSPGWSAARRAIFGTFHIERSGRPGRHSRPERTRTAFDRNPLRLVRAVHRIGIASALLGLRLGFFLFRRHAQITVLVPLPIRKRVQRRRKPPFHLLDPPDRADLFVKDFPPRLASRERRRSHFKAGFLFVSPTSAFPFPFKSPSSPSLRLE